MLVLSVAEESGRQPVTEKAVSTTLFRYNAVEQQARPQFSFVSRSASLSVSWPSLVHLSLIVIHCLTTDS